jgi:hypothetical protein
MGEFFKGQLKQIQMLTGSRQYLEICSLPTKEEAMNFQTGLIATLIRECDKFAYIPEKAKQKIISDAIIQDQDFVKNGSLNAKFVWKHLNSKADTFWKTDSYLETNRLTDSLGNAKPLSESTQKLVNEFMASLSGSTMKSVPGASKYEIEAIQKEDTRRREGFKSINTRRAYTVPIEDEYGKEIGVIENVYAESQENAKEIVLMAIKKGELNL